jgi:MFS family permease
MDERESSTGSRLPPVVRAFGAVSLCNDLASEMVYPLLPQLLTRGLGAGALALGALDGIADAVSAVVKLGAGWLSDRPRWRGPLVAGGYALAAVTRPLIAVAGTAWQVVALRAADRVGKGARTPPRDAMIADAVVPALRGRAFGFHRAMDHAGATIGPLVAGGLMAAFALPAASVVLWSAVPGVAAASLAAVAVRWMDTGGTAGAANRTTAPPGPESAPPGLLVGTVLAFAAVRLPETLMLLRLQDLGTPGPVVPVLWAALHVVRTAGSYPGGWLSDHMGPARTMLVGWLTYAGAVATLAATSSMVVGAGAFLVFGLVAACTESPERALVAAWGGRAARGRRFGIYHAGLGVAALPGGLAFGALYQWGGGDLACTTSAGAALALAGLGAVVTWELGRRSATGG